MMTMLEVYAFATPNSVKVPIALEELGLDYALRSVNVRQGEQKALDFLALNPNGKVPVLIDPDGPDARLVLTESAAILIYLAEKTGMLMPSAGEGRARVFEQLFFHASGLGPAFGQSGFFQRFAAEPQPIAIERFSTEAKRTVSVLDRVLAERRFVAGLSQEIGRARGKWKFGLSWMGFISTKPHVPPPPYGQDNLFKKWCR